MSAEEQMPKIRYTGPTPPKIDKAQLEFMRFIEEKNIQRVKDLKRTRRNNLITAGILGVSVIGIYAYSMLSVQQEKFLDDFEEPKKVSSN